MSIGRATAQGVAGYGHRVAEGVGALAELAEQHRRSRAHEHHLRAVVGDQRLRLVVRGDRCDSPVRSSELLVTMSEAAAGRVAQLSATNRSLGTAGPRCVRRATECD